jgi:hypothetical protein
MCHVRRDGRTALMWAAYRVFTPDTVRLLISMRADLNMQDTTRNTGACWCRLRRNQPYRGDVLVLVLVLMPAPTQLCIGPCLTATAWR